MSIIIDVSFELRVLHADFSGNKNNRTGVHACACVCIVSGQQIGGQKTG